MTVKELWEYAQKNGAEEYELVYITDAYGFAHGVSNVKTDDELKQIEIQ